MQAKQHSLIYLHIAVLLFGGTALFAKLIGLSAIDITVYRCAIAGMALFLFLKLQKTAIKLNNTKDYFIALILGIAVGLHWVTYFAGMQMAGVTIGILALFCFPVITVLVEPFFHNSKPKLKDIITAAVVVFGIYLIMPSTSLTNSTTQGIVFGIISALFYALRNIAHKRYFSQYSGPQTMLYQTLVAFIMLCAFIEVPIYEVANDDLLLIVIAGIVFTATPHSLFAASLKHLSAATAGLISCLQPLYGILFAIVILHEKPNIMTLIGGALIVSAAFYETWSITRRKRVRPAISEN
ncbi:DMT family transporter [Pseudoalteromonas sp. MMG010]|uniref:DMT family transporter n=1 Tax=Pseudoalteromonas sp. MMG010 TaxID=2822685 RepID=UPI001B3A0A48|nr:DMT family transporter [Pseudoalteromonas sp. MMG010]MBQ4832104.1 DMT family transporter [Pseudoalteromonas sp. MMG010]